MSKTPIQCCFCDDQGATVLDRWDSGVKLLLCIFPHLRNAPKIYACRKCLRLRWRKSDKEFTAEVLKLTQPKP